MENGGLKTLNKWVQHAYMKQQFDIVETAAVALARVSLLHFLIPFRFILMMCCVSVR